MAMPGEGRTKGESGNFSRLDRSCWTTRVSESMFRCRGPSSPCCYCSCRQADGQTAPYLYSEQPNQQQREAAMCNADGLSPSGCLVFFYFFLFSPLPALPRPLEPYIPRTSSLPVRHIPVPGRKCAGEAVCMNAGAILPGGSIQPRSSMLKLGELFAHIAPSTFTPSLSSIFVVCRPHSRLPAFL